MPKSILKRIERKYSSVYEKAINFNNDDRLKPIIYEINYHPNGRLRSILQYIDHKRDKRKYTYVPIWRLVMLISYLLAILIILLAALILTFNSPRPGLYNETCGYRSCVKGFGLKCLDNKCQCTSTQYYEKGCKEKKPYLEKCSGHTSYCQDGKNLICLDGLCKCNETHYWNHVSCLPKKSISLTCSNDVQCLAQLMLVCDSSRKACSCDPLRFWDGNYCYPRQTINETCYSNEMCLTQYGLTCTLGVCSCNSILKQTLWNGTQCQCPLNHFYDGSQCLPLREYTESCQSTLQCYTPGLLSCKNGICDCPLPISQRMYWVPEFKECRILPKNCKEVQQQNSTIKSGIFYLASPVGLLEAYCEMEIDGGGYTFLPFSSLTASTNMLQDIYFDKTKILFRIISRSNDTDQPYIITRQLPQYSNVSIEIQENSWAGYSKPINTPALGSYVFIGFLPASLAARAGMIQGFSANGRNISFTNCNGHVNSYFALYANLNPTGTSSYGSGVGMIDRWINSSLPHPLGSYMPSRYFFFTEIHQGGCGAYQQSDRWSNHYGSAFGMR